MNNNIKNSITVLCGDNLRQPADDESLKLIKTQYPDAYKVLKRLYKQSDGINIRHNGTSIFSTMLLYFVNKYSKEDDILIGAKGNDDRLVVKNGKILQIKIDEEEKEIKVNEWSSIKELLMDEFKEQIHRKQKLRREMIKHFLNDTHLDESEEEDESKV